MSCCVYYKYRTQKRATISYTSQYIGQTFECFHHTTHYGTWWGNDTVYSEKHIGNTPIRKKPSDMDKLTDLDTQSVTLSPI